MNGNLYGRLGQIGFRVNSSKIDGAAIDIEDLLIEALYKIDHDSRMISLVFSWAQVHHQHLLADKFFRSYNDAQRYLGECPWVNGLCAFLVFLSDHRFKKGVVKLKKRKFVGDRDQSSAIKMKGAIDYLKEINILVPQGNIRLRESDALSIAELVKFNLQYRNRLIFGTNWRAEIITAIMNGAQNANQVAKTLGIQRSRAGVVFKEYQVVKNLLPTG